MEICAGAAQAMATVRSVLMVSNHAEIVGGGEISLLGLLEALDRARWAPIAVVPAEGVAAQRCRTMDIPVHVVPMPTLRRPGLTLIQSVVALSRLMAKTHAFVVHANGSRAMVYAGLAAKWAGRPVVWHVRVADSEGWLDRVLFRLADRVVVNSHAVGRRFSWADPRKVRCIHNGVDTVRFAPRPVSKDLRKRLGFAEGEPVVASVGRLVPYKGYGDFLDAAALVQRVRPDTRWMLVGDGTIRNELEAQSRQLGLGSCVSFTGWLDDVRDVLALCDVFVLPSRSEHFGRVLIEAMAMGKPVVATDGGGVPEIVRHGETGLLVPSNQPASLAQAILTLLDDPVYATSLGAAGRARVEREFSLSRHVAEVERLYSELANG
ncbi:MAG TPA: glycosyltransferase family 4 protein [Chloroflexota bacterium]|nr:glycosyltransferase family 4 protein [Chloroflexota bacterium]